MKSRRPVNSTVMWLNLITTGPLCAILLLGLFLYAGCLQVNRFNHQPAMARAKAEQFADAAFIEHDLGSAYKLLSQSMRNDLTPEQFKDLLAKMHTAQYPDAVNATEYEPLMGQRGMNIYLFGQTRNEKFYYRFFMEGTKETDYTVGGLWRNEGPYPASNTRRPL